MDDKKHPPVAPAGCLYRWLPGWGRGLFSRRPSQLGTGYPEDSVLVKVGALWALLPGQRGFHLASRLTDPGWARIRPGAPPPFLQQQFMERSQCKPPVDPPVFPER